MRWFFLVIVTLGFWPAAPAKGDDALIAAILEDAHRHADLEFAVTRQSATVNRENEQFTVTERYDPSDNPRWSLWLMNGERPDASAKVRYAERTEDRPAPTGYDRVTRYLKNGAEKVSDADGVAVYRVRKLGEGSITAGDMDLSKNLEAEIRIQLDSEGPWVREVVMTAPDDFKPAAVARVEKASARVIYAKLESGMKVVERQFIDVEGSAMFRDFGFSNETLYFDYDLAPAADNQPVITGQ